MSSFGRKLTPNLGRVWNDKAAYPVIACMGFALYWAGYVSSKYLVTSPDVFWNRELRSNELVRSERNDDKRWNERHASWRIEKDQLKDLRVGYVPEKNSR